MVDDKGEVNHEACRVALAVGAGIRLVRGQTVVGNESIFHVFGIGPAENNNASAGTFYIGSDVFPSSNGIQILVLYLVEIDRDRIRQKWPVGVFGILLASMQAGQNRY